jgi:hypothetical protein
VELVRVRVRVLGLAQLLDGVGAELVERRGVELLLGGSGGGGASLRRLGGRVGGLLGGLGSLLLLGLTLLLETLELAVRVSDRKSTRGPGAGESVSSQNIWHVTSTSRQ